VNAALPELAIRDAVIPPEREKPRSRPHLFSYPLDTPAQGDDHAIVLRGVQQVPGPPVNVRDGQGYRAIFGFFFHAPDTRNGSHQAMT
jgi:hypothetical protein